MPSSRYAFPALSLRFLAVWRRHFLVWRKLAIPSILGNLADPMIMLFGLGYGLGAMLGNLGGMSYFAFLAAGFLASSSMYAASFEALYSAFSRMHVQKTWEAIVNAPMTLDDVLAGEWVWAASKSLAAGLCMLVVVSLFGYAAYPHSLAVIPVVALIGLAFGALGLAINALASGYDFFSYYMTLLLTPMMLLSGVFFSVEQLPAGVQAAAQALPLYHGVQLIRPLVAGEWPTQVLLHIGVIAGYAVAGFYLATVLTRRRLQN
jgi:lipooligosaccharide transport system permease protein